MGPLPATGGGPATMVLAKTDAVNSGPVLLMGLRYLP